MGGISIWQLLIIALIILLLFGSKKLRGLGGDLGSALRGFKKEMNEDKDDKKTVEHKQDAEFRQSTEEKPKDSVERDEKRD